MSTETGAIRVLALLESHQAAGPARNLIDFAVRARAPGAGLPPAAISIATFQRGPNSAPSPFVDAARRAEAPVHVLIERRRFDTGVLRQLREVVARQQPDILQTHNMKSHLLIRLLGLQRAYPWIAFHHGYTSVSAMDRAYRVADRWSLRAACRVVTVCSAFAGEMRRIGVPAGRIVVRHNAVDPYTPAAPEQVEDLRTRLGIPRGAPVILCVGRLSSEKGHRYLIEAAAILRRRFATLDFRMVIVGDGPERRALERACRHENLNGRIIFTGHQTDVAPYYSLAQVVALPSLSEGSPNVVLEAMAAGTPLAATAVGGVPELVQDEISALLVRPCDAGGLAGAIARLLQDRSLASRLAEVGRAAAGERHSRESYRDALLRLYVDVLQSGPAHGGDASHCRYVV